MGFGITQKLDKLIGDLYSPTCRAKFGDNKCKINTKKYLKKGKIDCIIKKSKKLCTKLSIAVRVNYRSLQTTIIWAGSTFDGLALMP